MQNRFIFKKNLEFLNFKYPKLYSLVLDMDSQYEKENLEEKEFQFIKTKSGDYSFSFKGILFHSKYNPRKEAERIVEKSINSKHDTIIIFGFAFGYMLGAFKQLLPNTYYIVIEKEPLIFYASLFYRSLEDIIPKNFSLIFDKESLGDIIKKVPTKNIFFYAHKQSWLLHIDFYTEYKKNIERSLMRKRVNIATLGKFEKIWTKNIICNLDVIMSAGRVSTLFNMFDNTLRKSYPVIIVGAGPSLFRVLPLLKKFNGKYPIFAVDTAVKIMDKFGIVPDIVMTVDAQIVNGRYLSNYKKNNFIIAEPSTYPMLRQYKGRIFFTSSFVPFFNEIEGHDIKFGEIAFGGSVSTNLFDLAVRMGFTDIFLCGQDLAFTEGLAHCRGSYYEDLKTLTILNRFITAETLNYKQLHSIPLIKAKGNNKKNYFTNEKLLIFRDWFSDKIREYRNRGLNNLSFYNCSDGIEIYGTHIAKLNDIIKFPEIVDILQRITRILDSTKTRNFFIKEKLKSKFLDLMEKLLYIKRNAKKGISLSRELYSAIEQNKSNEANKIIHNLDKIDKNISKKRELTGVISISIQKKISTLLENYTDFLSLKEKNDERLSVCRRSIMIYEAIVESTEYNIRMIKKIIEKLKVDNACSE